MRSLVAALDNPRDGYHMVLVPAGEAIFGSREDDADACDDERPQFRAYLPHYYLGKYPVCNKEYARFLDEVRPSEDDLAEWIQLGSDCHIVRLGDSYRVRGEEDGPPADSGGCPGGWAKHPAVQVSWHGAVAYCKWAGLRLPVELEWEKAARGPEGRVYPWGSEWDPRRCRHGGSRERDTTCAVCEYPEGRSYWGHYQMSGNVWEWCADPYDDKAYRRYARGDITPPSEARFRVRRGGAWHTVDPWNFRCTSRDYSHPGHRSITYGFRCAGDASLGTVVLVKHL